MRTARDNIKLMSDMAKVATNAMGSFGDIRKQLKSMVKDGIEQMMTELDLVTRAEFERVEAMAARAREKQEELQKRFDKLETGRKSTTSKTKTAVKKTQKRKKK